MQLTAYLAALTKSTNTLNDVCLSKPTRLLAHISLQSARGQAHAYNVAFERSPWQRDGRGQTKGTEQQRFHGNVW